MSRPQKLNTKAVLLLRAAVGLAAIHFPLRSEGGVITVSSRDVAFLLDGHVEIWSDWRGLSPEDTDLIVRLLRSRQAEYADGEWIRRSLRSALDDAALPGCRLELDSPAELQVSCAPGMPLPDFVEEALAAVEHRSRIGRGAVPDAGPGSYYTTVRRTPGNGSGKSFVDQRFQIRDYGSVGNQAPGARLVTSTAQDEIQVPVAELIELAEKLDAVHGGAGYRARNVERLCRRLRTTAGAVGLNGILDLTAGETHLLNAPTGVGKSVLMEILACWMVQNDLVLSVVVPNNSEVLKVTRAVETNLEALGLGGSVTALMSPDSTFKTLRNVLKSSPAWDRTGEWTLERLGYGCALAAAAESDQAVDAWEPGAEPCVKLRSADGEDGKQRACPWRSGCGKFRLARAALDASIIVTSHVNFHRGRLHLPIEDDRGINDRTTIEELILRRSHLVVIDEIDTFQRSVIDQAARGLLLDERGRLGTPLHTLEQEFVLAAGRVDRDVETSVRSMVLHSKFLASTYTAALSHGSIGATGNARPGGRYWLVPRRWDGILTAQLWGLAEGEPLTEPRIAAFRSLFPGEDPPQPGEPPEFAGIRAALATVTEISGGAGRLESSRDELDAILSTRIPADDERARAVDQLLQRAVLERIRVHLRQFVYNAPHLADAGVPIASEIAETFGPYSRWRAQPNGPMGRLLFAFRQQIDPTGRGEVKLSAAAFGGDPHTYTITIGDITSLCRAGVRRAVLGLSATAYFPQAPHHHVHLDPHWWVSDAGLSDVTIQPVLISDHRDGSAKKLKVSGLSGPQRDEALSRLAELLWTSRLRGELERLAEEDPDRRHVLLATTSYQGARMAAEGLLQAGVETQRICLAVRPSEQPDIGDSARAGRSTSALHLLAADRLEEFPALPGAEILIAPLARAERGINIIGKDDKSALGSIWLLVRPVPVVDEPTELIAHVNAHPLGADANDPIVPRVAVRPADLLDERKLAAGRYFEEIVTSLPYFRAMPQSVQLSIAAETMNGLIQLVGRARRGGTPARIYLADGAMLDSSGGPTFGALVRRLRRHWQEAGVLDRMQELYGSTLDAFFQYADIEAQLTDTTDQGTD